MAKKPEEGDSFGMGNTVPRLEPHSDMRQVAQVSMQLYTAHINEGFTPEQALSMTQFIVKLGEEGK